MTGEKTSLTDRLLSTDQGGRFDRWVEFIGVLVMSIATIATAWCAYQASLWGGDESKFYFEASALQVETTKFENQARQRVAVHVNLFSQYVVAIADDNQELADFFYDRFPPELRTATDAWLATKPLENPDAPPSPFDMPQYRLPEEDQAEERNRLSTEKFEDAGKADEIADDYVMLTVIFATVLFFSGISGKFQWQIIDAAVLVISVVILLVGLLLLAGMPIQ